MLLGGTVAGKSFVQHFEVGHLVYVEHSPVRQAPGAALSADLEGQKASLSVLHSIVVRLSDSGLALIYKSDLVAGGDGIQELVVNLRAWVADY